MVALPFWVLRSKPPGRTTAGPWSGLGLLCLPRTHEAGEKERRAGRSAGSMAMGAGRRRRLPYAGRYPEGRCLSAG